MRIAFVWDWENVPEQFFTWRDGLAAAMRILAGRHEVSFWTCGKAETTWAHEYFDFNVVPEGDRMAERVGEWNPDAILIWGDCTRPSQLPLSRLGVPMALCFAGGATDGPNWYRFSHVFVENEEYRARFEAQGADVSVAFGTNTGFYEPFDAPRKIDAYFPATFADWKRHDLFYKATRGMSAVCAGYMYPVSERYCWEEPMRNGTLVMPHVSADANRMLMAQSRCVLVTSKNVGGSQRTVLEALSMNVPVVVMSDNAKCAEYLLDIGVPEWICDPEPEKIAALVRSAVPRDTRQMIAGKWDEFAYADRIEAGLTKITSA